MDAATRPPSGPPRRARRTRSKLPAQTIADLASKGLDSVKIGKLVGAHSSTIRRFLDKIQPESQAVSDFKSGRADVLATLQAKNLTIQERLLERLEDDRLLTALTPSQMSGLIFALNSQHGTLFDKERLERGQSTANISAVSRMIDSAVSEMYKPVRNTEPAGSVPREGVSGQSESESTELAGNGEAGGPGGQGECRSI